MSNSSAPTGGALGSRPASSSGPQGAAPAAVDVAGAGGDAAAQDGLKRIATACSTFSKAEQHRKAKAALASFKKPATWVVVFGAVLAMCAGIVDVTFFLLTGEFVTNHTGHTAKVGMRAEGVQVGEVSHVDLQRSVLILICFVGGAFLCGMLIDKNQVHFGGKSAYGLALLGNSCLLVIATHTLPNVSAVYLGAIASGLQNAMCTSHFGAVVRTTHVTGTLTDIGSTMGRMVMILLRRRCIPRHLNVLERAELEVDMKKLSVLLPIYVCFLLGCIGGAYLEQRWKRHALLVPAFITGVTGFVYGCFRHRLKEQFKRMEVKRLGTDLVEVQNALERAHNSLASYHAQRSQHEGLDKAASKEELERDGDLADLDDQVALALEVVHDMECAIEELHSPRSSRSAAHSPARSRVSRSSDREPLSPHAHSEPECVASV